MFNTCGLFVILDSWMDLEGYLCVFVVSRRYGDMRVMMAYELFSMWQNLGECFDSLSVF